MKDCKLKESLLAQFDSTENPDSPGQKALEFFLGSQDEKPLNCAQSLAKAFLGKFDFLDQDLLNKFKKKGHGKAKGGHCGIIFAATYILENSNHKNKIEEIQKYFQELTGTLLCKVLKKEKVPFCAQCLGKTADYLHSMIH
jgi:hypothetical protein